MCRTMTGATAPVGEMTDEPAKTPRWWARFRKLPKPVRVTTYVEPLDPAPKPEDQVVSVEYFNDKGRKLGFLELVRRPSKDGKDKPEYVAKSERTRWHATVLRSTAEQIEQDLASVSTP